MDTQLSRFWRSVTARPCRSSFVPFDGTISSERVAPSVSSRRATRAAFSGTWLLYRRLRLSRLACDRARLNPLPLGAQPKNRAVWRCVFLSHQKS